MHADGTNVPKDGGSKDLSESTFELEIVQTHPSRQYKYGGGSTYSRSRIFLSRFQALQVVTSVGSGREGRPVGEVIQLHRKNFRAFPSRKSRLIVPVREQVIT